MFILVAKDYLGIRALGPFRTAARASGEGLNRFGPLTFGCPVRWQVVTIVPSGDK